MQRFALDSINDVVKQNETKNTDHDSPSAAPGAVSTAVVIGGCGVV
jgi:hypothetical protein